MAGPLGYIHKMSKIYYLNEQRHQKANTRVKQSSHTVLSEKKNISLRLQFSTEVIYRQNILENQQLL